MKEVDDGLGVGAQALVVGLATGVSLIFSWISTSFFADYHEGPLPGGKWFGFVGFVAGGLWAALIAQPYLKSIFRVQFTSRLPAFVKHRIRVAGLYILVLLCIALLGWYTLASGGTLRSPFSGALLAMALLSPLIAVNWWTPIAVGVPVLIAYGYFSEFAWPNLDTDIVIPPSLTFTMTIATTVIALLASALFKWADERAKSRAEAEAEAPFDDDTGAGAGPARSQTT